MQGSRTRAAKRQWPGSAFHMMLSTLCSLASFTPTTVVVYPREEMRSLGYYQARIPSIVQAQDGVLVAMAECNPCNTLPACTTHIGWITDLCSKRSFDGGKTWTNVSIVVKDGSQPNMIFDVLRGTIVLNCNVGRTGDWPHSGHNVVVSSADAGASWTLPAPLPAPAAIGQTSGPGVGLQLASNVTGHAGRLLFMGWRDLGKGRTDGDVVWYSDDGGRSYSLGRHPFPSGWSEAQLAETRNGSVVAVFRNTNLRPGSGRGLALSTDGGLTFGPIVADPNLTTNATCQASILAAPSGTVLFSAPATEARVRAHGVVRSSSDGVHWSAEGEFNVTGAHEPFGYSCLTRVPDERFVGLLYERWEAPGTSVELVFTLVPVPADTV